MHSELKHTNFSLLQFSMSSPKKLIENVFDKAKLIINHKNKLKINYLEIKGLEANQRYQLWLKKEDVRIVINVYSGKHWKMSPDFLMSERGLVSRSRQKINSLRIDDVQ